MKKTDRDNILNLHKAGHTLAVIASKLNIHKHLVYDVVKDEKDKIAKEGYKSVLSNFKANLDLVDYSDRSLMFNCYR